MNIVLKPIVREDIQTVWEMQVEAFSSLLSKYQDYEISPATESINIIIEKFNQPWTTYYFIIAHGEKVGVIRIVDKKDGTRKRISPIFILPKYQNKGYAQQAILESERLYGRNHWCLATILEEKQLLYLYEKLGYHQTDIIETNYHMHIVLYKKN